MCPIPITKGREQSLTKSLRTRGADRLRILTATEIDKQQRLGALSKDSYSLSQLVCVCGNYFLQGLLDRPGVC